MIHIANEAPRQPDQERKDGGWWRRAKLRKLCLMRHGNHFLPDDDHGRALLTALLCLDLKTEDALQDAPWLEPTELRKLRKTARRIPWDRIGDLVKLTAAEWEAAKLWFTRPYGMSKEEVRRLQAERNSKNAKERQQRKRQREKEAKAIMQNTPSRADVILRILADPKRKTFHDFPNHTAGVQLHRRLGASLGAG